MIQNFINGLIQYEFLQNALFIISNVLLMDFCVILTTVQPSGSNQYSAFKHISALAQSTSIILLRYGLSFIGTRSSLNNHAICFLICSNCCRLDNVLLVYGSCTKRLSTILTSLSNNTGTPAVISFVLAGSMA